MVMRRGVEPRLSGRKPDVLPIDDRTEIFLEPLTGFEPAWYSLQGSCLPIEPQRLKFYGRDEWI